MEHIKIEKYNGNIFNVVNFISLFPTIAKSKTEARQLIEGGGLSINFQKVIDVEREITKEDFIHNRYILLKKGKKTFTYIDIPNIDSLID